MSDAAQVAAEVLARHGGDPRRGIHRDELRKLTHGRYARTGVNGAVFGFREPWMVKAGDMRYLSEHGRRRLGV